MPPFFPSLSQTFLSGWTDAQMNKGKSKLSVGIKTSPNSNNSSSKN